MARQRASSDALTESNPAWRFGALFSLFALAVLAVLALAAPTANAAAPVDSYAYYTTFGAGGSGEFAPTYNGIAVENSTGRIFLPVQGSQILIYSPDPLAGGVLLANQEDPHIPFNVASDPSNGSIYLMGAAGEVVKLVSDGAPTPTYTQDPGFAPPSTTGGLAVDPTTHDVLIGENLGFPATVRRLDHSTGAVISSFDGSDTETGEFTSSNSLAVGPTGTIYVVDHEQPRVERMSSAGESLSALPLTEGAVPRSVAVNADSGEVVVLEDLGGGSYGMEGFTSTGQHVFSIRLPASMSGRPFGVAVDPTTGRIYVADEVGFVLVFVPAIQPGVDPPVVSAITGEGVHADAAVAPGEVPTEAWLEYCPASASCAAFAVSEPENPENPWVRGPEHTGLEGSGEEHVAEDFLGLEPNTAYLFRVHAENSKTENTSATTEATTALIPPSVQTDAASEVTSTAALLVGTIGTYGGQTTFHFEYGLSDDYGASVPAGAEGVAGNERAPRTFTRRITGLQPGTTYHYRLVAENPAGVTFGADRTFTTLAGSGGDQRGYELVTPLDKHGALIEPSIAQAAADGSGFEYSVGTPSTASNSAPVVTRFVTSRGTSGWTPPTPLDPPISMIRGIFTSATLAVSDDFTHSMVISNKALAPGAKEQAANIYVQDLNTGSYTWVATSDAAGAFAIMSSMGYYSGLFLAGAPDFSWLVFVSKTPLLPGVSVPAMYRWTVSGGLTLESRLPDGSIPSSVVQPPNGGQHTTPWVSEDGDVSYFSLESFSGDVGVYRRADGETEPISVSHLTGADPMVAQFGFLDGASSDGRYAFFNGLQLTEDAPLAFPNLYRYDSVTGNLKFIATLGPASQGGVGSVQGISKDGSTIYFNDPEDHLTVWSDGETHVVGAALPEGDGWSSANGRYLVYPSNGNFYLYDLAADQSSCMSCGPDGSIAASVTFPPPSYGRDISNEAPLAVTDGGLAFLATSARLLAADRNGASDVYSFKDGILALISPGDQDFDATYAGASADGSDVFFGTAQALVGRDTDESTDIYDARIGGGFAEPPLSSSPCQGDDCKGPLAAPPPPPTVGSSTVTGHGNANKGRHCPNGKRMVKVRKKTHCVKRKRGGHRQKKRQHNVNAKNGDGR